MERPCDSRAGYKHHLTKDYLAYLKQDVMDLCRQEQLHQVDLLSPAKKKVTDREYHARRRGQKKMDELNRKMLADGVTPRKTKFETQKDHLRKAIEETSAAVHTLEEFQKILREKYNILLKISRGRFSYLHPEWQKYITGRNLGSHYEKEYLLSLWEENTRQEQKRHPDPEFPADTHPNTISSELPDFVFIKSDLRLVVDLQLCAKAQQNAAYAQKVKLSNLQQIAKTVAYIQEHGYGTEKDLEKAFEEAKKQTADMRKVLRSTEGRLKQVNEQIHYTGQYLANKAIYRQFINSRNKKKFRQEHSAELTLYESARKFLKEQSSDGKLPSMKLLKEEKEKLTARKASQKDAYRNLREYEKELNTVRTNIQSFLGRNHSRQETQEKGEIRF